VVEGEIRFKAGDSEGTRFDFLPGRRAAVAGKAIEAAAYPRLVSPFLNGPAPGRWSFSFEKSQFKFEPVEVPRPAP
jgi:hypothetical protein